jgi:CBS domain containing-hemolysin-like protein
MKSGYSHKIKSYIADIKKYIKQFSPQKIEHVPPHPIETFLSLNIEEIMLPRSDIIAVSRQNSFQEVIKKFLKTGFHWLPVFRGTLDNIVGIVSIHCILSLKESKATENQWYKHVNNAFFAPSSMTIKEALHQFQRNQKEIVIFVVDEYGGIEGMLTKGHILRELVALFIKDFAEEEEMIISKAPFLIISGRMGLDDFAQEFSASGLFSEDDENRVNTIGGWICAYIERVPLKGEIIMHPSGFTFEILQANPRTIHQIAILQTPSAPFSQSKDLIVSSEDI